MKTYRLYVFYFFLVYLIILSESPLKSQVTTYEESQQKGWTARTELSDALTKGNPAVNYYEE